MHNGRRLQVVADSLASEFWLVEVVLILEYVSPERSSAVAGLGNQTGAFHGVAANSTGFESFGSGFEWIVTPESVAASRLGQLFRYEQFAADQNLYCDSVAWKGGSKSDPAIPQIRFLEGYILAFGCWFETAAE